MWYEDPAVVAGVVMLLACGGVATFLHPPLTGVLGEYAGGRTRGVPVPHPADRSRVRYNHPAGTRTGERPDERGG